jgi:glycosyltransferase involved in cell wall biosynthesis
MNDPEVYLVGERYHHHSGHSGYDGFSRYVGRRWRAPLRVRFLTSGWGWRLDWRLSDLLRRPCFGIALLIAEIAAAVHMLLHRKALYHVLYGDTDLWMLGRLGRLAGRRVLATFHESPLSLEYLRVDRGMVKDLGGAIVVSEYQREYFEQFLPRERIFFVPHGIDTEFFRPAMRQSDEPILLTVGGHTRDYDTLTDALDSIQQSCPTTRLVAISTHVGHKGRPFQDPRVEYLSGLSDCELRRQYQRAQVAVYSFRLATANNSILEAMSCGIPVVATDIGGVREYVGEDAGILCPPWDPEALAEGVARLLADPALRRAMGEAGRKRVARYDFRVVAEQQRQVYRVVAARSNP